MNRPFHDSFLPSSEQALLLKACLIADPGSAATALQRWIEQLEIDEMDPGSFQLVPLLWKRATAMRWRLGELTGRLRGIYRYSWLKHQIQLRGITRVLHALDDGGVRVVLLHGTALSQMVYEEPVCRPSAIVSVLVPHEQAERAIALLEQKGWTTSQKNMAYALRWFHGAFFSSPEGLVLELHWQVVKSMPTRSLTEEFLSRSHLISCYEGRFETLGFEDHIVHVCASGAGYTNWPRINWLADMDRAIRHGGHLLDWARIRMTAEKAGAGLPLLRAFEWLHREVETPIPEQVLEY
jgi:hypothetical protein